MNAWSSSRPSPTARPSPSIPSLAGFAMVGGGAVAGLVPGLAVGGRGGLGVAAGAFGLEVDGRVETSTWAVRASSGDRVQGTAFSVALSPCARRAWLTTCGVLRAGAMQGRAPDVARPSLGASFLGTAGLALRADLPQASTWSGRAEIEAALPVTRIQFVVDDRVVWTASPVYVGVTLAVRTKLW